MPMFDFRRQHPLAILLLSLKGIANSWREMLPLIVAVSFTGVFEYLEYAWVLLFLIAGYGVGYWWNFTYRVENGQLIIQRGIFSKKLTQIPRKKIQTIDITSGILQQLFRLKRVKIETAGSDENAVLHAVTEHDATTLIDALSLDDSDVKSSPEESDIDSNTENESRKQDKEKTLIYEMNVKYLLIQSVTSPSILILFGGFFYIIDLVQDVNGGSGSFAAVFEKLFDVASLFPLISSLLLMMALFMIAVFYTLIKMGNFELWREGDHLKITRGILETKQTSVPIKRIQCVKMKRNILFELMGLARVEIESAGSQEEANNMGTIQLLPVVSFKDFKKMLPELNLGEYPEDDLFKYHASDRSLFRFTWHAVLFPGLILAGLLWFEIINWPWLLMLLPFFPLAWWQKKTNKIGVNETKVFLQTRLIGIQLAIIPWRRVQTMESRASIFMLRNNFEDAVAHTVSGSRQSAHRVMGMERGTTDEIYATIQEHSKTTSNKETG
jgi:putative membrane protein